MEVFDHKVRDKLASLHVLLSELWLKGIITQSEFLSKLRGIHHAVNLWQQSDCERDFIINQLSAVEDEFRNSLKGGKK